MSDAIEKTEAPGVAGNVEALRGNILSGWASNGTDEPVWLRVAIDGVPYGEFAADIPRADVIAAGQAKIGCGFEIALPPDDRPRRIDVVDVETSAPLWGSPFQAPAKGAGEPAARDDGAQARRNLETIDLAVAAAPRISVIMVLRDGLDDACGAARALRDAVRKETCELIVIDAEAAPTSAASVFGAGCLVLRCPPGTGVGAALARGARLACGELLLLLDPRLRPCDGLLDALAETFRRFPEVGLAGARIAGTGEQEDSPHPRQAFLRDVDRVAGAVMTPRQFFAGIAGLDAEISFDAVVDALAAGARAAGRRVVAQPKACARAARDGVLAARAPQTIETAARLALFIDETTPTPDQDAGSNAIFEHMLSLQRLGCAVVFAPAGNMANIPGYTERLQAAGVECWYAPCAWTLEEFFERNPSRVFDLVYVHRKANLARYLGVIRKHCPSAAVLFNYADIHALRDLRELEVAGAEAEEIAALRQTLDEEIDLATQVDAAIVHSEFERAMILARRPDARVFCAPWTIPARSGPVVAEGREGIAFIGGFGHPPNADAVDWFTSDIWPLVAAEAAPHRFRIVGARMPARFESLRSDVIDPVGFVADLDAFLDACLLTVAPLRFGAGLKGKAIASFARGVPCVMTGVAAEGMDLPEDVRALLVADDAAGFSRRIARLVGDREAWRACSDAGLAFARAHFSQEATDRCLSAAIAGASKPPPA